MKCMAAVLRITRGKQIVENNVVKTTLSLSSISTPCSNKTLTVFIAAFFAAICRGVLSVCNTL